MNDNLPMGGIGLRRLLTIVSAIVLVHIHSVSYGGSESVNLNNLLLNASCEGSVEEVKKLLNEGADINVKNEFGTTPLELAVVSNNYDVAKLFLELGQNPNGEYLTTASANGYVKLVKLLLDFGANPDYSTCGENTALMSATAYPEIVKILIDHKANINARDNYNRTVLMWASIHGSPEVVELLCRLGVDIKQKDKEGNTALSEAQRKGRSEVIKILQKCSSDKKTKK